MFPWFFLWAPQYHLPWSGAVRQDISPDTRWFFEAIDPRAGDGRIEKEIFDVASYGRQIGILSEVVLSLVDKDKIAAAEAQHAIEQLKQTYDEVREIKRRNRAHRVSAAVRALEDLRQHQPDEFAAVLARFKG
jgi:hypothetical protein